MFSGIVESQSKLLKWVVRGQVAELHIEKPNNFNDLEPGHSLAVDGVCLTVETYDGNSIVFSVAVETLQVTGWKFKEESPYLFNLERSLKWGDRVHGHMVTGHVDGLGAITDCEWVNDSLILTVEFPEEMRPFIWKKGSVALNGVSLTVNKVENCSLKVCLIPESLRRTNLSVLKEGDSIHIELDNLARGIFRYCETVKSTTKEVCLG